MNYIGVIGLANSVLSNMGEISEKIHSLIKIGELNFED
jgi:hypothetical protein